MSKDMCVPCDGGVINIRVGAIIMKDGRFLMVRNDRADYCYSVGGRIKFGETAEDAVCREVLEETGVPMVIDRLGFVQENYFVDDSPVNLGKTYYELAFYFYMKTPEDFEPVCSGFTEDGQEERLVWVNPDEPGTIFPEFFRTELDPTEDKIRHIVCDERLYIRKMVPDDLEPLFKLLSDPEVMRFLEPPYTLGQTREFLEKNGLSDEPRVFAAEDSDHRFIGYVIFHDYDENSKEIGWILGKEFWGNGMADRLTAMLISMAASEDKDVVIECVPDQEVTKKIARKYGFIRECTSGGLEVYIRKLN